MKMAQAVGGHIIFEQATDGDLWARLPATLLQDGSVRGNAIHVYAALQVVGMEARHRGGPGYQGQEALGQWCGGLSRDSVWRAMKQLEEAGYIRTERVGLGAPDNITILRLP